MDAGIGAYLRRWRPSSVSPQAAAFARDVVAAVQPDGQERAKNLLWAAGKLADYAASAGRKTATEAYLGLFRVLSLEMWMRTFEVSCA